MEDLKVHVKERNGKANFLVGPSMMPQPYSERTVGGASLVALWFAMSVVMSIFMIGGQLYPALTGWQIFACLLIAHTFVAVLMWFSQDFGIKYGIPFAVSLRSSFGYVGAYIPIFCRALPGLFWFGFQTWVAAKAIAGITEILFNWSNLTLYIILFGAVQIAHTYSGIKNVTRLSWIASPLLLVVGIYLGYTVLDTYDVTLMEVMNSGGEGGTSLSLAIMAIAGGWLTMALSIMDMTRECIVSPNEVNSWWKSTRKFMSAQWIGLVPASVFFGMIGVICSVTAGDYDPVNVMISVIGERSTVMLLICLVFTLIATWTTNDTANLYPAGYGFSSLSPSKINFGKGIVIAGLIGLAIRPWAAADSLVHVMDLLGAALGPIFGIMISDYYVLRKRKLNLDDLYDPDGQYKYWKNWNPAAIISYLIALVCAIPFWEYMYIVGPIISGILYYLLMRYWIIKKYPQKEIKF